MKPFPMFAGLLLAVFLTQAAADCPPVKVRNPEGNYLLPGTRGEIVYAQRPGAALALDAYVQKRGGRRPAVVVLHGGGFASGSRVSFIGQFLEMLTRAGYNWFAIDYRKNGPERYSDSLDDAREALAFLRCHASEFRIDPDRLALLGEDTGATIAARLAAEPSARIRAAVLVGGDYAARYFPTRGAPAGALLVVHGTADTEAPPETAARHCDAFRREGGRCEFLPVEGAIHRPENWRPEQWGYKQRVVQWLGETLSLRKADHEPYASATLQKDLVYDLERNLKLDAYVPAGRGPHPAVLIAHGGGWEAGDKVTYATPMFEPLARAGFAWFSIDYRLTPRARNADQLDDLRAAIRYVRANARRFRIDPDRLALLGESASGQMVAQLATESPAGVAAVVSFYGVYDFDARARSLASPLDPRSIPTRLFGITTLNEAAYETLRRASPLYSATSTMPPLLLVCGTKDGLFAQHTAFMARLDGLRARYDAIAVEGAPHGMENWEGHADRADYKARVVAWLRARLRR